MMFAIWSPARLKALLGDVQVTECIWNSSERDAKVYKYIPERPVHNVFHLIPPIHHFEGKSHQYVLIPVCSRLFRPDYADYTITVILLLGLLLSSPDRQNQSDRCYPHRSMDWKSSRNHYYGWRKRSNYTPESAPGLYHQDSSGLLWRLTKPVLLQLYRLSILSLFPIMTSAEPVDYRMIIAVRHADITEDTMFYSLFSASVTAGAVRKSISATHIGNMSASLAESHL